ncbi:DUF6192 family protein [Streptomyces sp. NPDC051243]|uniref:DUF6192 family protein n=1 Tax=Streptomyces sp. NPDC051243 TaxID=3365646 RepID=UPI0037B00001
MGGDRGRAPFNPRTGARQWTPDGAKRVVGQRADRPFTVDEKVQAVANLPARLVHRRHPRPPPGRYRPARGRDRRAGPTTGQPPGTGPRRMTLRTSPASGRGSKFCAPALVIRCADVEPHADLMICSWDAVVRAQLMQHRCAVTRAPLPCGAVHGPTLAWADALGL